MQIIRSCQLALSLTLVLALPSVSRGQAPTPPLPQFADVEESVRTSFARDRNHHDKDLISRSQVVEVLKSLKQLGWDVPEQGKLLDDVLDDQHILVRTLRTPDGKRFANKIASRELIFDRLDRIAGVSGGPELIRDIVKLPNGEKYAKPQSGGGVPDLLDLLPKNASGRTRRIAHYDEPTGHIYQVEGLVQRLAELHKQAKEPRQAKPKTR